MEQGGKVVLATLRVGLRRRRKARAASWEATRPTAKQPSVEERWGGGLYIKGEDPRCSSAFCLYSHPPYNTRAHLSTMAISRRSSRRGEPFERPRVEPLSPEPTGQPQSRTRYVNLLETLRAAAEDQEGIETMQMLLRNTTADVDSQLRELLWKLYQACHPAGGEGDAASGSRTKVPKNVSTS